MAWGDEVMPEMPEVLSSFFARDAERDIEGIVALFTDDGAS
jgi:hypothetical protein